jgi:AcrR family transcriptional regulator
VSAESVYKAFGGKPGLVRAICARGLAGSGPVHAESRSDALQREVDDPRAIIRAWGTLTTEVAPRVAPILLLLRAAAVIDGEMAALQAEIEAERLSRMTHNARSLVDHLRAGLAVEDAAAVLWTYSSPEMYELLVIKQGWALRRYGDFIADALIGALLAPEEGAAPSTLGPATTR